MSIPEDTVPLEHTPESTYSWDLRHTDREVPHVDQIAAAIVEYQVELHERLTALDPTIIVTDITQEFDKENDSE